MIFGAHTIVHRRDAEADRAFLRDVLGFAAVEAGHGRLPGGGELRLYQPRHPMAIAGPAS